MYRKFVEILMSLAREVVEKNIRLEDVMVKISDAKIDPFSLQEEILHMERMNLFEDEEADAIKSILASMLLKSTEIEPDEVYSMLFNEGKRIVWN
ncbi:MAG: hypothetical protein ACM34I_10080 [bacterium]